MSMALVIDYSRSSWLPLQKACGSCNGWIGIVRSLWHGFGFLIWMSVMKLKDYYMYYLSKMSARLSLCVDGIRWDCSWVPNQGVVSSFDVTPTSLNKVTWIPYREFLAMLLTSVGCKMHVCMCFSAQKTSGSFQGCLRSPYVMSITAIIDELGESEALLPACIHSKPLEFVWQAALLLSQLKHVTRKWCCQLIRLACHRSVFFVCSKTTEAECEESQSVSAATTSACRQMLMLRHLMIVASN